MFNIFRHIVLFLILLASPLIALAAKDSLSSDDFVYKITPLPPHIQILAKKYIWNSACPVPLNDFAYVQLTYWGMDHKKHLGYLIINKKIANEVADIFHEIYKSHFPIEHMEPILYNDEVRAHDTAALDCRAIRGRSHVYSLHSYGYAIDINPSLNPYIRGNVVLPSEKDKLYLDRTKRVPGMIIKGDKVYQIFIQHGWQWGGDFITLKDYMHFEKPLPSVYHLPPNKGAQIK